MAEIHDGYGAVVSFYDDCGTLGESNTIRALLVSSFQMLCVTFHDNHHGAQPGD
jgi:hypothetical protein